MTENKSNQNLQTTNSWTPEQIQLIQNTVAKGTTVDELKLFFHIANKYQLDPLIREVWCVKYGTVPATIFTGRDGFLSIAHRSKLFNGMKTIPNFDDSGKLISATCTVYKKEMEHPIEITVWNQEYNTGKSNWAKMPITMLSKVAESQALRKAFNISGIYAEEEKYAIAETQTTVDANHVEVLSDEIQKQIDEANTKGELLLIWDANKSIQKKSFFVSAIQKRKKEVEVDVKPIPEQNSKSPKQHQDNQAKEMFDFHNNPKNAKQNEEEILSGIIQNIAVCEQVKDVNAYLEMIPDLKNDARIVAAANARKLAIGKALKGEKV